LCTPSDGNLKVMSTVVPSNERICFLEKEWKSNDEQLYTIFYKLVDAYWGDHLKVLDIKHVKQGNNVSYGLFLSSV
jgi:hypothetical protein